MTSVAKMSAREIVVNRLLEKIEPEKVLPWKMSWFSRKMPYNQSTMTRYRGLNVLILWALGHDYEDKGFMTYKQAASVGGCVRRGEKGFPVLFAQPMSYDVRDKDGKVVLNSDGTKKTKNVWIHRYYTVFNVEQIDGLPERQEIEPTNRKANDIISALGLTIENGDPSYNFVKDIVRCPPASDFVSEGEYYATLFHELVHWTGHESRLNRQKHDSWGDEKYSREELVAEIGASFLMAECGLFTEVEDNSAAYVNSWLEVLKKDKNMIISAASLAQRAVDYILDFSSQSAEA